MIYRIIIVYPIDLHEFHENSPLPLLRPSVRFLFPFLCCENVKTNRFVNR